MRVVAAIGSRDLSRISTDRVDLFSSKLRDLHKEGWCLYTGGSTGADHLAASIFTKSEDIVVTLFLPWAEFNRVLLQQYIDKIKVYTYDSGRDIEAARSVNIYHPFPKSLGIGPRKLLARNFLIIRDADLVIALPEPKVEPPYTNRTGGTYQGMRIAQDLGKNLIVI